MSQIIPEQSRSSLYMYSGALIICHLYARCIHLVNHALICSHVGLPVCIYNSIYAALAQTVTP